MTKKVIFGAFFHWNSFLHIGSHQYAKQFARHGYKVAYISKPISPLHFFFAKERDVLRERFDEWHKGGKWYEDNRIWAYTPFSLIPVYRRAFLTKECIVNNANLITVPSIRSILKKNDFNNVDILFLDEPDKYLLDLNLHKRSIYRIHDDITHFKKYPALFKVHEKVIRSVDLVVSSSLKMEKLAGNIGAKRTLYIPNGVEFEHFYCGSNQMPLEYQHIPSPRVVYVGSIGDWFNVELVEYVAKKLKDFSFILIGRPTINLSQLTNIQNVYLLGPRDYGELPTFLKNADIGVITWDNKNNWVKASHPNKLYMYMACGLPVVTTRWEELEKIKSPAYMASSKEEFANYLDAALYDKNKEKYIEFARKNSWGNRFKKLMSSLYSEEV